MKEYPGRKLRSVLIIQDQPNPRRNKKGQNNSGEVGRDNPRIIEVKRVERVKSKK